MEKRQTNRASTPNEALVAASQLEKKEDLGLSYLQVPTYDERRNRESATSS